MRFNAASISSMLTGRFSRAFMMPARSFSSSKGCRVPSCFTTRGITSSAVSKVVKRSRQDRHSLRRRTWSPSATRRESITLVSASPQKGQCINHLLRKERTRALTGAPGLTCLCLLAVDREPCADSFHLLPYTAVNSFVFKVIENVTHPAGQIPALGFLEAACGHRRSTDAQTGGHER